MCSVSILARAKKHRKNKGFGLLPTNTHAQNGVRRTPGNFDTGIVTTTQLPVFYRFFWPDGVRDAVFAWHNRFTT
jgi:hypothetical protein